MPPMSASNASSLKSLVVSVVGFHAPPYLCLTICSIFARCHWLRPNHQLPAGVDGLDVIYLTQPA